MRNQDKVEQPCTCIREYAGDYLVLCTTDAYCPTHGWKTYEATEEEMVEISSNWDYNYNLHQDED